MKTILPNCMCYTQKNPAVNKNNPQFHHMHTIILIPAVVGGTTGSRLVDPKMYTKCLYPKKQGLKLIADVHLRAPTIEKTHLKQRGFRPTAFTSVRLTGAPVRPARQLPNSSSTAELGLHLRKRREVELEFCTDERCLAGESSWFY